jgi:hypothetical protein
MSETHQLVKIDVGVYPKFDPASECWPVDKSATKDWDASDSTVTEACLTALGFFIPQSRSQKLKWCYKAKMFRSDFLVVALADTDVVFGSADCERIKVADDEKSSFPILPSKKSAGTFRSATETQTGPSP